MKSYDERIRLIDQHMARAWRIGRWEALTRSWTNAAANMRMACERMLAGFERFMESWYA